MSEISFLSGKVLKQTLPRFPTGGQGQPPLKRLNLAQGELAVIHDGDVPVRYVATLELTPDSVRGNHYHKIKLEHVYVLQGELELVMEEPASGKRETTRLQAGELVVIHPLIAHAFRTVQPGWAIEYAPTAFNANDIVRHQLL